MITLSRLALIALPAAAALVAAPMLAQGAPTVPGTLDKARVVAGTYSSDVTHSQVAWRINHFGFSDVYGLHGGVSGTLTIDPANLGAAKVDVAIPLSQVVTANPKLTAHLLKPAGANGKADFFGAAPADATFKSTSIAPGSDGTSAKVTGDFTLNGVTKPVTLDVQFTGAGTNPYNKALTVGFKGNTAIKRSDFGIGYGLPIVSDEVRVTISVAFEKK